MIFVTLGTQDKPFDRLIKEIEKLLAKKVIKDDVIIQAGSSEVTSKKIKVYKSCTFSEYNSYLKNADLIITHGGVGSIIDGISISKKVVAVPRLKKYGESANDHQQQIVNKLASDGYIIAVNDIGDLGNAIINSKNFKPKKYIKDNSKMLEIIENYIENN